MINLRSARPAKPFFSFSRLFYLDEFQIHSRCDSLSISRDSTSFERTRREGRNERNEWTKRKIPMKKPIVDGTGGEDQEFSPICRHLLSRRFDPVTLLTIALLYKFASGSIITECATRIYTEIYEPKVKSVRKKVVA